MSDHHAEACTQTDTGKEPADFEENQEWFEVAVPASGSYFTASSKLQLGQSKSQCITLKRLRIAA